MQFEAGAGLAVTRGWFKSKFLLFGMLGFILAAGVFFRVHGYATHATYIDELICLTAGHWNSEGTEDAYGYTSPLEFATKMAMSEGVTYAPLQFFLTYYFIKDYRPLLSVEALAASRIPSVIIGSLSMLFLGLLFYGMSNGGFSYSYLLPLMLLAGSRINIVNSQQNHTYSMGVLAFIALMLILLWFVNAKKYPGWIVAALLLCILPFANYQIIPIVIIGIGLVLCMLWTKVMIAGSDRRIAGLKTLSAMPAMAVAGYVAAWIMKHKAADAIPWWAMPFGLVESSGEGFTERAWALVKNIYFVLESVLSSGTYQPLNQLAVTAAVLIMLGGFGVLIYKRGRAEIAIMPVLVSAAALALFVGLYFLELTALAPSRHTLILTAPILAVVFYCSWLLENSGALHNITVIVYRCLLVALSVVLLIGAVVQYPDFARRKIETFQAGPVIEFSRQEALAHVITDWWTYNKAYIFLRDEIKKGVIHLSSAGEEADFPDAPFLLVGQNTEDFYGVYNPDDYKDHALRALYRNDPGYDFEPSPRVTYWPNRMVIYRVWKK
jgi:hypothetical protein